MKPKLSRIAGRGLGCCLLLTGLAFGGEAPRIGNASITGKVIDGATSGPIEGALVHLEAKAARDLPRDSTRTDAEGNFSFEGLPGTGDDGPGFGYIVIAFKERYNLEASGVVPLKDGEKKTVNLALERILMMRLRVRESPSGGGISGATAVILRAGEEFPYNHALTDSAGEILFGQFRPGQVRISVAQPGFRTASVAKILDGMAWEDTAEVVLGRDLPVTSRSLHGKVTDPTGKPAVVPLFFSCTAEGGEAWLLAVYGAEGNYVLKGIPAECASGFIHTYAAAKTAINLTGSDTEADLVRTPIMTEVRKGPAGSVYRAGKGAGRRDALGRIRRGGRPSAGSPPLLGAPALFKESAR